MNHSFYKELREKDNYNFNKENIGINNNIAKNTTSKKINCLEDCKSFQNIKSNNIFENRRNKFGEEGCFSILFFFQKYFIKIYKIYLLKDNYVFI